MKKIISLFLIISLLLISGCVKVSRGGMAPCEGTCTDDLTKHEECVPICQEKTEDMIAKDGKNYNLVHVAKIQAKFTQEEGTSIMCDCTFEEI